MELNFLFREIIPLELVIKPRIATCKLNNHEFWETYQRKISEQLTTERGHNVYEQWDTIRNAIRPSAEECCGAPTCQLDLWISYRTLSNWFVNIGN